MAQPAYAGVAVGLIFIALIGLFFGYRLYKRLHWRRERQRQAAEELPAITDMGRNSTHFPTRSVSPGPSMFGSLYGDSLPRDSWRGSSSKASLMSMPMQGSTANEYGYSRSRRSSSLGMTHVAIHGGDASQEPSMPGSPIGQGDVGLSSPSDIYDGPTHTRALSSASSTMTLKRSYASSAYRGSSAGFPPGAAPPRRDSYLPHLPGNRDAIQIVPPQPLGFSFGMAQAVDQKTLAFSKTSGIGDFDDVFAQGMLWTDEAGNQATDAEKKAAIEAHISRGGTIAEEDRLRYLAQGPSRSLSPGLRGAIHNHLYESSRPGSSGARTPDGPGSRSRSPAPATWDGSASSSDIGPSVSQRGTVPPSHPLEVTNPSQSARNATTALASEQSPLGLMTFGGLGGQDTEADLSVNTVNNSPILKAFQNPEQARAGRHGAVVADGGAQRMHTPNDSMNSTHTGVATPALMSSDSRSQTSSRTGPPSVTHGLPSEHHSSSDQYRPSEEKRTTSDRDGRPNDIVSEQPGPQDGQPISPSPAAGKEKRNSGGLLGRWRRSSSGVSPT